MNSILVNIFSPGQTATIVIVCVVLALVLAFNAVLMYFFHKQGERKLCTHQLQNRREELLNRLDYIKNGGEIDSAEAFGGWFGGSAAAQAEDEEAEAEADEEAEDELDDVDDDEAEDIAAAGGDVEIAEEDDAPESAPDADILAVREMSVHTREMLGYLGTEYDRKQFYVRYSLSFEAKLLDADDAVKERYKAFITECLLYKGVKIKSSFRQQRITKGRKTLGLIFIRGKTLCIALALNPADYAETKYRGIDKSDKKRFADTPMMYKLTSDRRLEYAKYLLTQIAEKFTIVMAAQPVVPEFDFGEKTRDELLLEKKLRIKIIGEAPDLETETDEDYDDEEILQEVVSDDGEEEYTRRIVYNRSFSARVIQANDDLKARYSELKNYILSYQGVSSVVSWQRENFRIGKDDVAAFAISGKTLCLYLAADPAKFADTKYAVEDMSGKHAGESTPTMYRVMGDRRTMYAKQLIDAVLTERNSVKTDRKPEDYTSPYKSTAALVRKGLIREVVNDGQQPQKNNKKSRVNSAKKEDENV